MATLTEIGDGVRTLYRLPLKTGSATATVNGSSATISSQGPSFVVFQSAPAADSTVVITYTPAAPSAAVVSAADVTVAGFTTAGGTPVAAGSAQEVIEAVADLADPGTP